MQRETRLFKKAAFPRPLPRYNTATGVRVVSRVYAPVFTFFQKEVKIQKGEKEYKVMYWYIIQAGGKLKR